MYTLGSTEFNQIIETPNNQSVMKRLVLLDNGTIIDKIKSLTLYSSSSSQELQLGTTNMAYIEAEVDSDLLLTNREVRLECGVTLSDGSEEYIPMGVFTIQKPQGDIDFVKFKAHDNMQKFEKVYSSELTYPTTSNLVLDEICNMCGVALSTPIENPIEITEKLQGYTCREVLGFIAGIHGKFACIDRLGTLNLRWYSETPIDKQIGLIWAFNKSDDDFTVDKIEIAKDTETNYTSGSGFSAIYHSNPLATQEIVNDLFTSLNGFTYNASVVDILDDIRLDLGDVIKVTYLDGKDYLVPCMSIKQDFTQGSTNIESFAKSDTENTYRFTGPTVQYLNRMATELILANRVIATKVDAEYVNSHAITTENFEAKIAEITELVVDEIDGKYANIDLANIDIANINVGKIGELFAKVGLIDRATIVEGHITGFLDAVEINANKITAGTLIADRILLSGGENGVLYALNNLGELTSTNVDTLDGYILTDRTITADKIIANSITTNELDVDKIFGNEAVLNKIVSQEIFSDAVATNRIVVGKADVSEIIAENLLPYPYKNTTSTINGITFTDNGDGSITMNGTATADAIFLLSPVSLKAGTYTLSVSDSGFNSNYCNFQISNSATSTWWGFKAETSSSGVRTYTLAEYLLFDYNRLLVKKGHTMNNVTWKPMVEVGSVAHKYREYAKGGTGIANNLYYSGTTEIDGGKIYTGSITADAIDVDDLFAENINMTGKFISTGKAQLAPGIEEMNTISKAVKGEITLTNAQKTLYDLNKDGTVNIADFMLAKSFVLGRRTIESLNTDFGYVIPQSNIQTVINSSNPQKVISISATNSWGRQIEAYFGLDGLSVPKVETNSIKAFGIEVEDEIDAVGDVYANYGLDTRVSLLGLQGRINKLNSHPYSLIRSLDIGAVSTSQTVYNTFNGRKISDYGMILITMGGSEDDIRASLTVSRTQFDNTTTPVKTMYLDCWSANGTAFHQIAVKWVSDTQIMIYATTASTATKYVNISGIKVDDATI